MYMVSNNSIVKYWDKLLPMFKEHCNEVHLFPDKIPLNPSFEHYKKFEELGLIETYLVRNVDGIIGYSVFTVTPNPHYVDHIYASNDVIFIDPKYRHIGVAEELVAHAEDDLQYRRNVSVITYHMKPYKPFKTLMENHNYSLGENLYVKCLLED